jgi:hypothetical protein
MAEINWTILTYIVVGLFAIAGFSRGWWKEAVTTVTLVIFVILLQNPTIAQMVVDLINGAIAFIWDLLPESIQSTISSFLETIFGVETNGGPLQLDPGSPGNWLMYLLLFLVITFFVSRILLPHERRGPQGVAYRVTPIGAILGALLGGLNGFIILNLVQEYLFARNLPGLRLPTEVAFAEGGGGAAVARASSGLAIRAAQTPGFSLFDGVLPWILIIFGGILFFSLFRSRVGLQSKNGFRRIVYRVPYGYRQIDR